MDTITLVIILIVIALIFFCLCPLIFRGGRGGNECFTAVGTAGNIGCKLQNSTIYNLMQCVYNHMPPYDTFNASSYMFNVPTSQNMVDWYTICHSMMTAASFSAICAIPKTLAPYYQLVEFTDTLVNKTYWVLMETDVAKNGYVRQGWGTFIYYPKYTRQLHIWIPHPIYDENTWAQGINVFSYLNCRSYLCSGCDRQASTIESKCQSGSETGTWESITDPAHNYQLLFQETVNVILDIYGGSGGDWNIIEFHGMEGGSKADAACPWGDGCINVFLTFGTEVAYVTDYANAKPPYSRGWNLVKNFIKQNPKVITYCYGDNLKLYGTTSCMETGDTNVQARLINGVSWKNVCEGEPSYKGVKGNFLHIEQTYQYRDADYWYTAIQQTWPVAGESPVKPSNNGA